MDLSNCLQKSAKSQQQAMSMRQKLSATPMQLPSNPSKIELAHRKLLARQTNGQSHHRDPSTIAVEASLEAFRAALAATSLVANGHINNSNKKIKVGVNGGKRSSRISPPSSNSTASSLSSKLPTLGGSARREGVRRGMGAGGGAPRSSNAKKYRCDICEKTFSRSNTLITHKVGLLKVVLNSQDKVIH
jgi:hypothetical protein